MIRTFYQFILVLALCLCVASSHAADSRVLPESRAEVQLSYASLVKRVAPAVVNIYTRKVVKQRMLSPFMNDPFFQQFFGGLPMEGSERQRLESSLGSGVLVRSDGLIVTNNHVIAGADQITVVTHDRREYEASILTTDEHTDLAVLRIPAKNKSLPFLELADSDTAEVGDLVLALGNPFGVGQTVTSGIISAMARTTLDINDLNYFIQTDAAINPGNSGGALVGMDGKLVGINSAIFSRSGGNMGIGFAIPSNMVRAVIKAVSEGKKNVVRPWTGIEGQEVTSDLASSMNLSEPMGVLVNALHSSSPAKKAGLRVGDVIITLNGKSVEDPEAFRFRIATLPLESSAEIEILRLGHRMRLTVQLIPPPEDPPRQETKIIDKNPLMGAVLANLSPAVSEELGLRGVDKGVVLLKASNTSIARLGMRAGDIILAINGRDTPTVKDILLVLRQSSHQWKITLKRGKDIFNIAVTG